MDIKATLFFAGSRKITLNNKPEKHINKQYSYHSTQSYTILSIVPHSKTVKSFIMKHAFIIASLAIIGAMASPAPSVMGIEVVRKDGLTMVREVVSSSDTDELQ
jgi:non-ribosomal peptide synthetase component E (peptide arylation enzyme)